MKCDSCFRKLNQQFKTPASTQQFAQWLIYTVNSSSAGAKYGQFFRQCVPHVATMTTDPAPQKSVFSSFSCVTPYSQAFWCLERDLLLSPAPSMTLLCCFIPLHHSYFSYGEMIPTDFVKHSRYTNEKCYLRGSFVLMRTSSLACSHTKPAILLQKGQVTSSFFASFLLCRVVKLSFLLSTKTTNTARQETFSCHTTQGSTEDLQMLRQNNCS